MSYEVLVTTVTTKPHPNADRLRIGEAGGYQVLVGTDTIEGEPGLLLPEGGQLNKEFAERNGLLRHQGGYIEDNRRVRTLKLRGVESEGLFLPLRTLKYWPVDVLLPTTGKATSNPLVASKYETPATRLARAKKDRRPCPKIPGFKRHFDTPQLRRSWGHVIGQPAVVTEKLHGTSGRTGKHRVEIRRNWFTRALAWLFRLPTHKVRVVTGTRRTILSANRVAKKELYRWDAEKRLADAGLNYGETVYYELVGKGIQPCHRTPDDAIGKSIEKKYGPVIEYTYGTNTYEMYVYRITQDGDDLSWDAVLQRCRELGVQPVPELFRGLVDEREDVTDFADGMSVLCGKHPREGVVVRVGTELFKYKSFDFCHLEGIAKNDETFIDTEEVN